MEFNHNTSNVTHTHHNRRDDDNEQHYPPPGHNNFSSFNQPPPPHHQQPPFYPNPSYPPPPHQPETQVFHTGHVSRNDNFNNYPQPPPPHQETQVFHTGHVSHQDNFSTYPHQPPPPQSHHQQPSYGVAYPPAPPSVPDHTSTPFPNATVHHVSHETHNPHFPSSNVQHVGHEVLPTAPPLSSNRPTFKIVTKASPNYSLTIRRGEVVLAPSDPSDQHQHWYKDVKWSTKVKDKDGYPSFALVNKVTGEAIKHSIGASHPVRLVRYNPDYLDQSVLWTESKDQGSGYRAVRMVNNIQLNMDAFHGDKNSGGVHDGTTVVLWDWNNGDNQQWKILPY